MFRRFSLLLTLCCALSTLTFLPAQTSRPQMAGDSDLQALKLDSQRMRALLNQMRTNLAFVDSTQSPLKHQFELEADMWQMMLDQMDRRIAAMEGSQRGSLPNQ